MGKTTSCIKEKNRRDKTEGRQHIPITVMSNWLDPSFSAVSLALHVTVVVPTEKLPPDITTLPAAVSYIQWW